MQKNTEKISKKRSQILKGKELQPGHVIVGRGMIIEVDIDGDSFFYDGKPSFSYYDINDSSYGSCSTSFDLEEEFEVCTDRRDIVHYFKIIDYQILSSIADLSEGRRTLKNVYEKTMDHICRQDYIERQAKLKDKAPIPEF